MYILIVSKNSRIVSKNIAQCTTVIRNTLENNFVISLSDKISPFNESDGAVLYFAHFMILHA